MMLKKVIAAFLQGIAFFELATLAYGGEPVKNATATRASAAIVIDGELNEPSWEQTPAFSDFTQFDPEEGAEPTEKTSVRMLYDDNALYVGVVCYDSEPGAIERQITRRDRTSQADRVSVIIDSYYDKTTAFLFSGSVSGVVSDGVLSHDGLVYDVQWDAVWDFSAQMIDEGWVGEFKIPFSALRFTKQEGEYVWGINFRRYIARKKETVEWVMVPRNQTPPGTISSVSKMGIVTGLRDIEPAIHLDVVSYVVAKTSDLYVPQLPSLKRSIDGTLGVDIKYGITNNSTLDIAINPDFGQVEVDQAVLNLTVFETFYPEKRPFFLEGSQMFSFGTLFDNRSLNLFYSRRIGRQPFPPYYMLTPGYFFAEYPHVTTILGAAKYTGRTEDGLSIGALSTVTQRESASEQNIAGMQNPAFIFEPEASYNVIRLKQDFADRSSLGFMATGAFRETAFPSLSGGIDWRLRFEGSAYAFDGYIAGSLQTPEIDRRVSGTAGRIGFGKVEAEHWLGYTFYEFSTKNFNINDLGYYSQPREHGGYTQITYKEDRAEEPMRRYGTSAQMNYRWNWNGDITLAELELEPSIEFRNFWTATVTYKHILPAYDDENSGIVGLYRRPSGDHIAATLQSDIRKPVQVTLQSAMESSTKGMEAKQATARITIRPTAWMELVPGLTYYETRDEEAWVIPQYTDDGLNLFGRRDIDLRDFSLRGTFTLTPRFSLQFFTQVFLLKVRYNEFKKLTSPTMLEPYDTQASYYFYHPDYNEQILNANVVLRWEYLPGSSLYLVWTHARTGFRGLYSTSWGEDFAETFRLPMDNVLLFKISYLWSL